MNVRIHDLNPEVDRKLDQLATIKRCYKHQIVKMALEEYVKNHEAEIR